MTVCVCARGWPRRKKAPISLPGHRQLEHWQRPDRSISRAWRTRSAGQRRVDTAAATRRWVHYRGTAAHPRCNLARLKDGAPVVRLEIFVHIDDPDRAQDLLAEPLIGKAFFDRRAEEGFHLGIHLAQRFIRRTAAVNTSKGANVDECEGLRLAKSNPRREAREEGARIRPDELP